MSELKPDFTGQINPEECIFCHKIVGIRVGSHDPFFLPNYFSVIVSAHRNVDSHH